jgi:hypothetical protein
MTIQELLTYIFEGQTSLVSVQFEEWVKSSRRFRAFAETYRDKIRKKLRTVENDDALKSLYTELEVAYRLSGDQRIVVEYEKYGLGKKRGPDFSIQYRTNTTVHLEVTRLRFREPPQHDDLEGVLARKLLDTLLDKVGQTQTVSANILLIISEYPPTLELISSTMASLRLTAERKEEDFFTDRGYRDSADFLKYLRQLSLILYRADLPAASPLISWQNPLARYHAPKPFVSLLDSILMS